MNDIILFSSLRRLMETALKPVASKVDSSLTPAAVLVAMVEKGDIPHVIFTHRTMTVATHKGQICFPGGMVDAADIAIADTALREAEEEIGLKRENVEIVGYLDGLRTVTDFWITPVVGIVKSPFEYILQAAEVAEVFEVPLEKLRQLGSWQTDLREYHGLVYRDCRFRYGDWTIWGATGKLAYALVEEINAAWTGRS